jgi:hypothetical protein
VLCALPLRDHLEPIPDWTPGNRWHRAAGGELAVACGTEVLAQAVVARRLQTLSLAGQHLLSPTETVRSARGCVASDTRSTAKRIASA